MSASGVMRLSRPGKQVDFHYPTAGGMQKLLEEIFLGREYPVVTLPGVEVRTIVDVGANVGGSAMYFHLAFPDARLVCFEPSPTNFAFLRKNFTDEGSIDLVPAGLSDRDERVELFVGRDTGMQSSVARGDEQSDAREPAELRRASAEFDRLGLKEISILKLDAEGCELPVLRDLGQHRLRNIDFAYIEYHSESARRAIDELMSADFVLAMAQAIKPHRGMFLYMSRRMIRRFPQLDAHQLILPTHAGG